MPPRRRKATDPLARALLGISKPIVETAGHRLSTERTSTGESWIGRCSCGFTSPPQKTPKRALGCGVAHITSVQKAAKEAQS